MGLVMVCHFFAFRGLAALVAQKIQTVTAASAAEINNFIEEKSPVKIRLQPAAD
jgi:hypothetical protein